jgi:hypothetical protein
VCDEHVPFAREACAECELRYHEDRERLSLRAWFGAGFAMPWALLTAVSETLPSWSARSGGFRAITTGVPMLDIVIMTGVIAVFAGKAAVAIRSSLHRRAFMRPVSRGAEALPARPVAR